MFPSIYPRILIMDPIVTGMFLIWLAECSTASFVRLHVSGCAPPLPQDLFVRLQGYNWRFLTPLNIAECLVYVPSHMLHSFVWSRVYPCHPEPSHKYRQRHLYGFLIQRWGVHLELPPIHQSRAKVWLHFYVVVRMFSCLCGPYSHVDLEFRQRALLHDVMVGKSPYLNEM